MGEVTYRLAGMCVCVCVCVCVRKGIASALIIPKKAVPAINIKCACEGTRKL